MVCVCEAEHQTGYGGRATTKVEAEAARTQVLSRTGSTTAEPPPSAAGPAKVTAVRLRVEPASYSGPCPSRVKLVGEITTDGAGTVRYEFLAGAVRKSGPALGKITFSKAGTQTVTLDAEYIRTPAVPNCSLLREFRSGAFQRHLHQRGWLDSL